MDLPQRPLAAAVSSPPTADAVRAALNAVIDPCSVIAGAPGGLVDMGLVREVTVHETGDGCDVDIVIGVTEPTCLMGVVFLRDAEAAVRELEGVGAVTVRLDHTLRYDASMQTPHYAERLAAERARRGITIGARR